MRFSLLNSIRRPQLVLAAALVLAAVLLVAHFPVAHAASSVNDACQGVGLTDGSGSCGGGSSTSLGNVLTTIINIISAIVGAVAVIMIVIGGFKYVTSGGDSNKVSGAKQTITYAIVGLIVVALAQLIVHIVINSAVKS